MTLGYDPTRAAPDVGGSWCGKCSDADFPNQLVTRAQQQCWTTLHAIGNREVLRERSLGLICSVQCPGSVVIKAFDAIRELRDAGVVIAGGFHSPMEQECLDFLLRGEQPVIICLAKGLGKVRLPTLWKDAADAGRLLVISPFENDVRRTTRAQAESRNEFVAALATAVLVPHASPGGKAAVTAQRTLERGQTLFTFDDEENAGLFALGARPYDPGEIRRLLASDVR